MKFESPQDALLFAAARGEVVDWDDASSWTALVERAAFHGAHGFVERSPSLKAAPAALREAVHARCIGRALWEAQHRRLLAEALAALAATPVQPLVFKGSALAYTLYPQPELRERGDTDLLIAPGTLPQLHEVLSGLGWQRQLGVSGEFVSYQDAYVRELPDGGTHVLDVHWKINNAETLSQLFRHEELMAASVPLPRLAPQARGPSHADAMLLACLHRCTHLHNPYHVDGEAHFSADRLVWLYDIHLLCEALDAPAWDDLVQRAAAKGLKTVLVQGLEQAASSLGTGIPTQALSALHDRRREEPVALYLRSGSLRRRWMDFRALGSATRRLRFAREVFFPSADYMHERYGAATPLPWLYAKRTVAGLLKSMRGRPGTSP